MEKVGTAPIWWLHPGALLTVVGGAVFAAAWGLPATLYESQWHSAKYFDDRTMLLGLAAILLFAFGVAVSRPVGRTAEDNTNWTLDVDWPRALRLFRICTWLCYTGYAIWVGAAISRGANLDLAKGVLTGEKDMTYLMKDTYLVTLGGLTTLTQFGIAAVILGCILACAGYWRAVRLPLLTMLVLAVVRSVFNSERLAVIELLAPATVLALQLPALTLRLRREYPAVFHIVPVTAAIGVFLLFTASEYLRSWVNFYADRSDSIWEFAAARLFGYYVTAANNSAFLLSQPEAIGNAPYFTVLFLWRFPVLNTVMRELFPGIMIENRDRFADLLDAGTNPEFNNNGGLLLPFVDFDIFGGLVYWLAAGLVCGWVYRRFRRNRLSGLLLYPLLVLSLLEAPRIIYWAEGRVFPAFVLLLIAIPLLRVAPMVGAEIEPERESRPCAA
jgi:oligosaccharide repeat unit polymerase